MLEFFKNKKLKTKFILFTVSIVVLFAVVIGVFINFYFSDILQKKLKAKGISISRNLVANSINLILTEDYGILDQLVNDLKREDDDIFYVFIKNYRGEIISHTFYMGIPKDLADIPDSNRYQVNQNIQLLKTEEGFIYDIAVPVLDGRGGWVHIGVTLKNIQETIKEFEGTLLTITVLIALIGITFAFATGRLFTRTLSQITRAAEDIGGGDLEKRIDYDSKDELGILVRTFNKMAESLEKSHREIKETQDKLVRAEKLAAIGRLASGVAHEINNPLGGVMNCFEVLSKGSLSKEKTTEYIRLIQEGLKRIDMTIKKLISISKDYGFVVEEIDIGDVLKDTVEAMEPYFKERRISMQGDLEKDLTKIKGDLRFIKEVFVNIFNNAIDSMPNGGTLKCSARSIDNTVEIKISDTGCGISKENLKNIFDPFYTTKDVGKGQGLGLSMSLAIVERHGGTIDVESQEGKGTTFIIKFPLKYYDVNKIKNSYH